MINIDQLYQLSTVVIGVECLVMTLTIWILGLKKNNVKKTETQSIIFFSLAIFGMSAINLIEFTFSGEEDLANKLAIVIFAASIELFLFMFAYISILDDKYVSRRKIALEMLFVIIFTLPPIIIDNRNNPELFKLLFYIALIFYVLKLILNVAIYKKYLSKATEKLQSYYSEASFKILKWINNSFFLVLTIGVVSTIVPISNMEVLLIYNTFLICAYMYIYALIIRNISTLRTKISSIDATCDDIYFNDENNFCEYDNNPFNSYSAYINYISLNNQKSGKYISNELYKQWIRKRLYTRTGITVEETAAMFCTNRSKFSLYLKNELNTNFYEWIAQLRIEDAKQQLIDYPEKLISDIGTDVGIEDRSNFTRTFKKITGFSPQTYRSQYLHQNSN